MSDTNTTLNVGVAKAYWGSKESKLLVSNPQFGERKCINVAVPGSSSTSKSKNKMSRHGSKKGGTKKWVHPPEALLRGHIVYNVKFLGNVAVENPKGTDVVKEAIRKMKFNKQIKKAEGQKPPKVELTISVDGVTIQEPKYKVVQHQYPLHRISYCADDKSDKRMLTFIGKAADSDEHHCFVFDSDKCAEEITLTIGQAFDLAYKKFLEKSAKDIDLRKQFLVLQKKVQQLTQDNLDLKARCADLERLLDPTVLTEYESSRENNNTKTINNSNPTQEKPAEVGRKLENLVFDDLPTANNTWNNEPTVPVSQMNGTHVSSPSTTQNNVPMLSPPPPVPTRSNVSQSAISFSPGKPNQSEGVDMFGQKPFTQVNGEQSSVPANPFSQQPEQQKAGDPFGMVQFNPTPQELEQPVYGEKELMDLQAGFSRGLSFGTSDFTLDDLDPLKN